MKLIIITICAATLLALPCQAQVDSATAMKNWQMYMTPGEEHKMLAKSEGTWDTEVTYWVAPGVPAQTSKGTTVNKMIMGGRYLEMSNQGNMMGMPFEGVGITGFDNAKKKFVTTWIDNMGTGFMILEGPWDAASKSIILTGLATDPMVLKEIPYKEVFKIVDDNTQVLEMYGPGPDGKEFKSMVITYKRRK